MSKREPLRDEFDSEQAFTAAWAKWRDDRDQNNRSVKRSRQRAKQRRLQEQARSAGRPIPEFPEIDSDDDGVKPVPQALRPGQLDADGRDYDYDYAAGVAPVDDSALGLAMASNLHLLARHINDPAALSEEDRRKVSLVVSQLV